MKKSKYWDVIPDRVDTEWLERWWGKAQPYWPAKTPREVYLGHMAYENIYIRYPINELYRDAEIPDAEGGGFGTYRREHDLPYDTKPYEVTRPHFIKMVDASFDLQRTIYLAWDLLKTYEDNRHHFGEHKDPARVLELTL